jgi:Phage integrase, N-terminal SAM-like domain
VREYAERWIEERPGLAPRTVELYRSVLRCHIAPKLGNWCWRTLRRLR